MTLPATVDGAEIRNCAKCGLPQADGHDAMRWLNGAPQRAVCWASNKTLLRPEEEQMTAAELRSVVAGLRKSRAELYCTLDRLRNGK